MQRQVKDMLLDTPAVDKMTPHVDVTFDHLSRELKIQHMNKAQLELKMLHQKTCLEEVTFTSYFNGFYSCSISLPSTKGHR